MNRLGARPIGLMTGLYLLGAIPVLFAAARVVQIPLGTTPADVAHLMTQPLPYWLHALAGASFGLLGPVQFGRALAARYGRLHRVLGRVFVLAGAVLGLSGLQLVLRFHGSSTLLLDGLRAAGGAALLVALWLAVAAVRRRDMARHRRWMIRAFAIGMGQSLVAFVLLPIYLWTGEPPVGLAADMAVLLSWAVSIALGEMAIRKGAREGQRVRGPSSQASTRAASASGGKTG